MPPLNELSYLYHWCVDQERVSLKIKDGCKGTDVLAAFLNIKEELIWIAYWLYDVYLPDMGVGNNERM